MSFQSEAYLHHVVALGIRVDFNGSLNPSKHENDVEITIFMSMCTKQ
jgi:hypothetical protein